MTKKKSLKEQPLTIKYSPVTGSVDCPETLEKKNLLDSGIDVRACLLNEDKTSRDESPPVVCYYDSSGVTKVSDSTYIIGRGKTAMVKTGMVIYLLEETFSNIQIPIVINNQLQFIQHVLGIQVRPRSGLAYKQAVTVLNSPGTIDQNYIQELGVLLTAGEEDFIVEHGDRIAQIVPELVPEVEFEYSKAPPKLVDVKNTRQAGFGSTGIK